MKIMKIQKFRSPGVQEFRIARPLLCPTVFLSKKIFMIFMIFIVKISLLKFHSL